MVVMQASAIVADASRTTRERLYKMKIAQAASATLRYRNGNGRIGARGIPEPWLASWMVMSGVAPEFPGVTEAGVNVATACAGSPDADIVTALLNAPPSGDAVTVALTE